MGMRIGNTAAASSTQSTAIGQWQQRQQGFKDLMSALQSGNLSAAQSAYATLTGGSATTAGTTATAAGTTATASTTRSGSSTASSPLAQIGQALASDDLAGAQKAAQAMMAARSGGHHHHHQAQGSATTTPIASNSATDPTSPGSIVNLSA